MQAPDHRRIIALREAVRVLNERVREFVAEEPDFNLQLFTRITEFDPPEVRLTIRTVFADMR